MSTQETKQARPIKEDVLALSNSIQKELSVDSGVMTGGEKSYESNLPEGLTIDLVTKVDDYNTTFVAGATHAVGTVAIQAMKADSSLNEIDHKIPMSGKNHVTIGVERKRSQVNSFSPDKEVTIRHGVTTVGLHTVAGNNAGELKKVRNALAELGREALKS